MALQKRSGEPVCDVEGGLMTKKEAKAAIEASRSHSKMARLKADKEFYTLRSILGYSNKALFYILLGGRDYGKSYSIMQYFLTQWATKRIPFVWIRLNEASTGKLLKNNADKLVDPDLRRKFGLKLKTVGNDVYDCSKRKEGEKMCTVLALSTYYNDKGVALFDNEFLADLTMHYNICCDEFQPEKDQRSQGDVAYQFVNQMENVVRDVKQAGKVRIFLCANCLEEASDILCLFNYIPEEFGRYWIASKRAVIDYMEPTEKYMKRRSGTVADILMPKASTFTNKMDIDKTLVTGKRRLIRPTALIQFRKGELYTVWDDNVIAEWNGEKAEVRIAMRPYQDWAFVPELRDRVFNLFDTRCYCYKHVITMKRFQSRMEQVKPRGK